MHKKLAAALTIAIFIISTLAVVAPVNAAFTLGYQTPTYPYRMNDYVHVPGYIGYVWPGGGQDWYTGAWGHPDGSIGAFPLSSPGYQSPWPSGNPKGAPGGVGSSWYQLEGNTYAPFGAVLAGSSGDLIFAINATYTCNGCRGGHGYDRWYILIPPEFTLPDSSQISTTIRNDYRRILTFNLSPNDRYAPNWHVVYVWADPVKTGTPATHEGFLNFTSTQDNWYYVRVNGVTAPTIAGRYFFKMWLHGADKALPSTWVNATNWPVMLVKGEVDPAIITGNIRYGSYNASLSGLPLNESGRVWAKMKTKLDPYTSASIADCTMTPAPSGCTDAVGYFNATYVDLATKEHGPAGHYEVEGVAPGIYDIYASAMGYPQSIIASNVQVQKGQSLHLDGYLNPGIVIHGTVDSKHQFGTQPFPRNDYIKIDIYNQPTGQHWPTISPLSWSPLPCTTDAIHAAADDAAAGGCIVGDGSTPQYQYKIEAPWHEYLTANGAGGPGNVAYDWAGVGPAQLWQVFAGGTRFYYQFGEKGKYGAPTGFDGHVPQVNATWVDGLQPGRYYVRAWLTQYVQTTLDGSTFNEVGFNVPANEWAGDVTVPLDLRLSDIVNKTVHFHDTPGTLTASPIDTGETSMVGQLTDSNGNVWASNVSATFSTYQLAHGISYVVLQGFNNRSDGEDYGIPAGTYNMIEYAGGYVQQTVPQVSVALSGTVLNFSDHLYRGLGFNITLYSIDWERPRVSRNWLYLASGTQAALDVLILDHTGAVVDSITDSNFQDSTTNFLQVPGGGVCGVVHQTSCDVYFGADISDAAEGGDASTTGIFYTSIGPHFAGLGASTRFESGTYSLRGWTPGYIQDKAFTVSGLKGDVADIKINLLIGANVSLLIPFKKEGLLTPTAMNMSARVRVFDDSGMLVGTWFSDLGVNVTSSGSAAAGTLAYHAIGHDGTAAYPWMVGYHFVPGGVSDLKVNINSLSPSFNAAGDEFTDPVFGYLGPDAYPTFTNSGILGAPDYTGGYTAEVDFVPWYRNNTSTLSIGSVFYPPVNGLLMGESYHFIPGSDYAADGGFGYTEAGALSTTFLGHSMAPNHLGPYGQQGQWLLPNAYLGGETSGIFEVDLRGYLAGNLNGFTWSNEFRTLSWSTPGTKFNVQFASSDGHKYSTYAQDGIYETFLPDGTYALTISAPGMTTITGSAAVSAGQSNNALNFNMEESGIPIPEFSGIAIVAFSALAASLYLLRRRRR